MALGLVGLVAYGAMIWWDLPPPGDVRYLPQPHGQGLKAEHWWQEIQALRGWSAHPRGWTWPLLAPAPVERWLFLIGVGLVGALLLLRCSRPPHPSPWIVLPALVVLAYAGQLAALGLKETNGGQLLVNRIVHPVDTGYFTAATRVRGLSTFFSGYADANAPDGPIWRVCIHCRKRAPGPILLYWLPLKGVEALPPAHQQRLANGVARVLGISLPGFPPGQLVVAALVGHLLLVGAALVVVPLYGLARRLAGADLALPLATLGVVAPGVVLMAPTTDQVYATATATLLYLAVRGLMAEKGTVRWGLGAGLWWAVCLYFTFGVWVLAGPLLGLAMAAAAGALPVAARAPGMVARPIPIRHVMAWLGGVSVGVAVPWTLLWGLGAFDLPRVASMALGSYLGEILRYPYAVSLLFVLTGFLQMLGLPVAAISAATLFGRQSAAQPVRPPDLARSLGAAWLGARVNVYSLLFWATLVAIDLSGTLRTETGRVLLFLVPLALSGLYAAAGAGRVDGRALGIILAAQFALCVLIGGRWMTLP